MGLSLSDAERLLGGLEQLDQLTTDMRLALAILRRIGDDVTAANDKLTTLETAIADTASDVLAAIEQLRAQLGELPADAAETLGRIETAVQALDDAVGDADGSDGEPEPAPEG